MPTLLNLLSRLHRLRLAFDGVRPKSDETSRSNLFGGRYANSEKKNWLKEILCSDAPKATYSKVTPPLPPHPIDLTLVYVRFEGMWIN